jgi:hypothetical protein
MYSAQNIFQKVTTPQRGSLDFILNGEAEEACTDFTEDVKARSAALLIQWRMEVSAELVLPGCKVSDLKKQIPCCRQA